MRVACIVMAGGRGSRMGLGEKHLLAPCGRSLLEEVVEALRDSGVCREVIVATTPRHPRVASLASGLGARVLLLPGDSYVDDLRRALAAAGTPALVASGDLHGLTPGLVRWFTRAALEAEEPVVDLAVGGELVGLSLHKTPTGGAWRLLESPQPVVDVDTPGDLEEAAGRCG